MNRIGLLERAAEEARQLRHSWLGVEHLLLALAEPGDASAAGVAVKTAGISYHELRNALLSLPRSYVARLESGTPSALALTAEATRVQARADGIAIGLGDSSVGSRHLLMAIVWEPSSQVMRIVERLGASRQALLTGLRNGNVRVPSVGTPEDVRMGGTRSA